MAVPHEGRGLGRRVGIGLLAVLVMTPVMAPAIASGTTTDVGAAADSGMAADSGTGYARAAAGADTSRAAIHGVPPDRSLSTALVRLLDRQRFDGVYDLLTGGDPRPSGPDGPMPIVDLAVIELGGDGRPRAAANALLDARHPHGVAVQVRNLGAVGVRWRPWDEDRWEASGKPVVSRPGAHGEARHSEREGGREAGGTGAQPIEFMSPFPASVLKLMVGFGVLRLVDRGRIPAVAVRESFDAMISHSDNAAAMELIRMLHQADAVGDLNRTFERIGLGTLRLVGTNPSTGGAWTGVRMTSLDTARLLLLVSGAPGPLWRTPDGKPVTADILTPRSRAMFYRALADQGLNHALSTTNWCGRRYPAPGIPQLTPERWINPDHTVSVEGRHYGQNVAPCDAAAEVTFAHKTGWTTMAGGDAGIVRALPGKPERDYIVVLLSTLGARFGDPYRPPDPPGTYPVPYTEKIGKLGKAVDDLLTTRRGRLTLRAKLL